MATMLKQTIKVVETWRVSPAPAGSAADKFLPLTFFDIKWVVNIRPVRLILFYHVPGSYGTLVPKLKHSLSLALGHYFPLAGSLAYPITEMENPVFRCTARDSVPFTIAVAEQFDFDNLVGNHPRDADLFYDFIPQLPPVSVDETGKMLQAVLAVQVTLFPGRGFSVGVANHHVAGDAASIVGFIRAWATICRQGSDSLQVDELPVFDRSLISDPPGVNDFYWNMVKQYPLQLASSFPRPTHRARATFVLHTGDLNKLKGLLLARMPGFIHASSFVVTTAHVWTSIGKALVAANDCGVDGDAEEFFLFPIDCRARLDPPVPGNYFGNCFLPTLAMLRHQDLVGDDGFFLAAAAVAKEIRERAYRKENLVEDDEKMLQKIKRKRLLSVLWSAKVDLYGDGDFGWGKPRKQEIVSNDDHKYTMVLCKSGEFDGGLEVGLSLPNLTMEAFATAFSAGLV